MKTFSNQTRAFYLRLRQIMGLDKKAFGVTRTMYIEKKKFKMHYGF
jgi:hypothetical protein